VLYAGNLGEGQGLHAIIPELARRMGSRVRFQIVGEGGRRVELERRLAASGVTNVEMLSPVARPALRALYRDADVLFAHLNDYDAFRKVLPSKLFEYAALGKPIWAGVAGYAAEFVRAEIDNAAVFPPCDVDAAVVAFERLRLTDTPRPAFLARYSRASISRVMAADILATAAERR
jgi:glycosyltransferase involved in cell wall biosynthesis